MNPDTLKQIKENASLFRRLISSEVGRDLDYDLSSLEYIDGYIERVGKKVNEETKNSLIEVIGSFVGEAIVSMYNGEWIKNNDYGYGVRTSGGVTGFPFTKVTKRIEDGEFDSIASFARSIPFIEAKSHEKK